MSNTNVTLEQLVAAIDALPPWPTRPDFGPDEWERYIETAHLTQQCPPATAEAALDKFIAGALQNMSTADESESKPFILLRVVFDLPESAPAAMRRSFKGWVNWPPPNASGEVNLSWPVSWQTGRPKLITGHVGSMGLPYAASQEYRHLLTNFSQRQL